MKKFKAAINKTKYKIKNSFLGSLFKKDIDKTQEIQSKRGKDNVDINLPTEEFDVEVLGKEVKKTDISSPIEEVSLIVKSKVEKINKDLIKKDGNYFAEKNRLEEVRKLMIFKNSDNYDPDAPKYITKDLAEEKRRILLNLGYISPTYSANEVTEPKEPISIEEDLMGDIIKDVTEEVNLQASPPTAEIPVIETYSDEIFEEKVEEILKEATGEIQLDIKTTKEIIDLDNKNLILSKTQSYDEDCELTIENDLDELPNKLESLSITEEEPKTIVEEEIIVEESPIEELIVETVEEVIEEIEEAIESVKEQEQTPGLEEEPEDWAKDYVLPTTDLLANLETIVDISDYEPEADIKKQKIDSLFKNFNVAARVESYKIGPTVTTYEVSINPGTKITRVTNLEDNIKLDLGVKDVRIQAPIPGKSFIGIEVPNTIKIPVPFKEVFLESEKQIGSIENKLMLTLGKNVFGEPMFFDLSKAPHLLVAGSTGSGKSVLINTFLASLLLRYKPTELKLVLIDPKMVEFTPYHGIPHLMSEVITNAPSANIALREIVNEMEERYKMMAASVTRNLEELNVKNEKEGKKKIPYIVVVIDELADLMMVAAKEVEDSIRRITQKARATGIHMILATQRPSIDVITGVIKSNIPSRIAFTVPSSIDSRTILDAPGANKLIGMGDMLVSLYGKLPVRGQGAWISIEEIQDITSYIKEQAKPVYTIKTKSTDVILGIADPTVDENDPLYISAKIIILQQQRASTSLLQRYLSIGYNKAANLIDALEANGVIGPSNGSKPREVFINEGDK